jgi:hypothetical protein
MDWWIKEESEEDMEKDKRYRLDSWMLLDMFE